MSEPVRYDLSDPEIGEIWRNTGRVYDYANVALSLLQSADDIGYRTRKNLETVITELRDANSQNHTAIGLAQAAAAMKAEGPG